MPKTKKVSINKKFRVGMKGIDHYNWGKTLSEYTKNKISDALTGRQIPIETTKKMSLAHSGISKSKKINWGVVKAIRQMALTRSVREIKKIYPQLSLSTINDIRRHNTWKEKGRVSITHPSFRPNVIPQKTF